MNMKRTTLPIVGLCLCILSPLMAQTSKETAAILTEYMAVPRPENEKPHRGDSGEVRMLLLIELQKRDDASGAIADLLPSVKEAWRRAELADNLGRLAKVDKSTGETAAKLLDDPDALVRRNAIHALRLLSRTRDVRGFVRQVVGATTQPRVEGLFPHLKKAAGDKDTWCRIYALYALADCGHADADREKLVNFHGSLRRMGIDYITVKAVKSILDCG